MEPIYEVKSIQDQILLVYEDGIVLTRKGKNVIPLPDGERTYLYSDITSIEFRNCGWVLGYMDFNVKGLEHATKFTRTGQSHENHFTFTGMTLEENKILANKMSSVKAYIQAKIDLNRVGNAIPDGMVVSIAQEIGKFKDLLDQGIINQEEFDRKKKELLHQSVK